LETQSDGSYKILNVSCQKYMRVEGSSTADGANVGIKNDYGAMTFKWTIREAACVADCNSLALPTFTFVSPNGVNLGSITITNLPAGASSAINDGAFTLGKKVYSGLIPGFYYIRIKLNSCETYEDWYLERTRPSVTTFDPNECYIILNKARNQVLEVKDDLNAEGALIVQSAFTSGKKSQLWQITKLSDGRLQFKSKSSGKLIDAPDCTSGASIKQFAADGTSSQTWRFETGPFQNEIFPDGSVKLVNQSCNKYLVDGGSLSNDDNTDVFRWYIDVAPVCVTTACPPKAVVSRKAATATAFGNITISNLPLGASSSLEGPLIDNPVFTTNKTLYEFSANGRYKVKISLNGCVSDTIVDVPNNPRGSYNYNPRCYRMVNKATGKVLTIKDASLADGTAVMLSTYTGAINQKWTIGQAIFDGTTTTAYITKSGKNWLNSSRPLVGCFGSDTGLYPVFLNKFSNFSWYSDAQPDGSYILRASPGCTQAVFKAVNTTSSEVVVGADANDNTGNWLFEEVSCPTSTALSTQETFAFEAQAVEGRAKLQWVTNADDIDYFNIERKDANGDFEILDRQNALSTENGLKTYTFTDFNPLEGDNFYRIHTILNGNTPPQYSEVKKVSFIKKEDVGIFPNPASDFIDIDLRKYEGKKVTLSVYNQVGKLLKIQVIEKASSEPVHLDLGGQGDGQMLLRISAEGRREVMKKFLIQH
jgi:hypothetical protein